MPRPKVTRLLLAPATAVTLLLCLHLLPATPHVDLAPLARAHTVEIAGDVGATLHIEPTDTPRAGEVSLAWFALTRKGGQTIPLSACACELAVSSATISSATTSSVTTASTLTPPLNAINAEGYEGIPSAEFTFPAVGLYTLSLTGSPKQPDDFSPFTFSFEVTVAAGQSVPTIPVDDSAALPAPMAVDDVVDEVVDEVVSDPLSAQRSVIPIVLGLGIVIVLGGVIGFLRAKQKS